MLKASGIHVTTVTPFKESFELDLEGVKENIAFLLETEISSVVPLGTVGEFASLTKEERKQVTERVVDAVNGKKTTIVGVSHTSFAEVVELAKHAKDCGADAVLLVPPYYYRDRDDGLVSFFEKILLFRHLDVAAVLQGFPIQIVYVKEVMNLLGMHGGSIRPPLTQLTHEKKEELKRVLEVIGKSGTLGPLSMKQRVSREK